MILRMKHFQLIATLGFLFSLSAFARTPVELKGQFEVVIVDDFKNKREFKYAAFTNEKDGKEYRLELKDARFLSMGPKKKVKVSGVIEGNKILEARVALLDPAGNTEISPDFFFKPQPTLGDIKAIFVLIKPSDRGAPTITPAQYKTEIADKVAQHILEDSYGQARFQVTVTNYFETTATASQLSGGPSASLAYIGDQLIAAGIDVKAYDKVTFAVWGSGGGIGSLGGAYNTSNFMDYHGGLRTTTHEIGHTMGFEHAAGGPCHKSREFCEINGTVGFPDVMSYDMASTGYFNSIHKERAGWLDTPVGNVYRRPISSSGIYTIKRFNSATGAPEILKIETAGEPKLNYYIEYRRPVGFDSFLASRDLGPTLYMNVSNSNHSILVNDDILDGVLPFGYTVYPKATRSFFRDFESSLKPEKAYRDPIRNVSFRTISMNDNEAQIEVLIGSLHPEIPSISLLNPVSPISKHPVSMPLELSVSAMSSVGVARVEFYKTVSNTRTLICTATAAPFKCAVITPAAINVNDEYVAVAIDSIGQKSKEVRLRVSTDFSAPICNLQLPATGAVVAPNSYISAPFYESDNGQTTGSSRSHYEIYLNNRLIQTRAADSSSTKLIYLSVPNVVDATHELSMKCFDKAGNSGSSSITLISGAGGAYSLAAPSVAIKLYVTSLNTNSFGRLSYTLLGPVGTDPYSVSTEVSINGHILYGNTNAKNNVNDYPYMILAPNNKVMSFQSIPYMGNGLRGPASNIASYTVGQALPPPPTSTDTVKPVVSITSPVANSAVAASSTVTIQASASDNIAVVRVEFYVDGALKCSDTSSAYSCAWSVPRTKGKTYLLEARAFDAAGNMGTHQISVSTGSGTKGGGRN